MYVWGYFRTLNMAHSDKCLADLKAFRQSNIPVYSFAEHQRLEETKYLYGATVIIGRSSSQTFRLGLEGYIGHFTAEGILALHDPALRALYDLKVSNWPLITCYSYPSHRSLCSATRT